MSVQQKNNLGQATTELAIFASIFFVALGVLLSIGQSINHQIATEVEAYKRASDEAWTHSSPVTYVVMYDKHLGGVSDSFREPSRSSFSGTATVLWGQFKSQPDIDSYTYYKINDDDKVLDLGKYKKKIGNEDKEYYPSVWDVESMVTTGYASNKNILQNPADINQRDTATITQQIVRNIKLRYYDRKDGVDEDIPKPKVITQSIYPKETEIGFITPNWERVPSAYTEQVGYKAGGGGIKWQRDRTTLK